MEFMKYPKINTVYKRDQHGKIINGEYTSKVFKYLANNMWYATEKVDGANIQVRWDCENKTIEFGGREENAEIPDHLMNKLNELFTIEKFSREYPNKSMILFGEGYGNKINKGSKYIGENVNFILFDVYIGKWLALWNVKDIARNLNIDSIPIVMLSTLKDAIDKIKSGGFHSVVADDCDIIAEGYVLKPLSELYFWNGNPVAVKIKVKDFR